jgi:acyl-CoA synthetase (AMP-forming)/AMP-acid ligase II
VTIGDDRAPTPDRPGTAAVPARSPSFPPFPPTSGELIHRCAERFGDKTFAVLGEDRITYAEAEAQSAQIARGLLATGAGKGTRVGLLASNSPEWIVGWLGITRLGAVAILLNTYSKAAELSWVLRHSDAQVLLTVDSHLGHDYLARLEQAIPGLADQADGQIVLASHPYLRTVWAWGHERRPWAGPISDLVSRGEVMSDELLRSCESEVTPADPMVVVYSSGSTADPKGAVHAHGPVVRHAHNLWQMRDLREDDVLYTPMPLFWVGGFSFTLIAAMHAGATLVFEDRFEPAATLELIERERVTQVLGWPHMAKALVEHPSFTERDLSSIRSGSYAALLPQAQQADAEVPKANSLGMTETLGPHTFDTKDNVLPPEKEGSFGLSVPGVEHKVVDPVTLEDLPVGATGELWLRGYSLMLGLHKKEREHTFTPDGWYRTGDGGYFDGDGHFYFTGRMGDLIKSAGMNITPRDVELALEAMPEVVMAFVTGIPAGERGQDVVAAVALRPGDTLDEEEARQRVKEEIASYKVPRRIAVFADQTELPWLDSGKIDRRRLTAILEDRFAEG